VTVTLPRLFSTVNYCPTELLSHSFSLSLEGKDVMKEFTLRCHTTRPSRFSACHRATLLHCNSAHNNFANKAEILLNPEWTSLK
jgi:hypothetical protein